MNDENLIPTTERSKSETRSMGRKGGVNSGKARREKRDLRKIAEMLLSRDMQVVMPDGTKEEGSMGVAMVLRQLQKAIKDGDTKAAKYITNLVGEETFAPANNTNIIVRDKEEQQELIDVLKGDR